MRLSDFFRPNTYGVGIALGAYLLVVGFSSAQSIWYCRTGICSAPTWVYIAWPAILWLPLLAVTYIVTNYFVSRKN